MNEAENNPDQEKNKLAIFMLVFILLIVFLVILDANLHLIANTWWYDVLLHILGGTWIGTLFIYLFSYRRHFFDGKKNFLYSLAVIVGFAALMGVLWELYEFGFDQTIGTNLSLPLTQPNLGDTMKDLLDDILGGVIATLVYFFKK
ncbi:hypothetical protein HY948_03430 [Candidatus Gottesmanbacteria bacterium]|nr:hypothetical protein [Candidatus Gottesmanbacteria bacterium]